MSVGCGLKYFSDKMTYRSHSFVLHVFLVLLKISAPGFFWTTLSSLLLSLIDFNSPDNNYKVWNVLLEVEVACHCNWFNAVCAIELTAALLIWAAGTDCSHLRREGCRHFGGDRFGQLVCPNLCKLFKTNLAAMRTVDLNNSRCHHSNMK